MQRLHKAKFYMLINVQEMYIESLYMYKMYKLYKTCTNLFNIFKAIKWITMALEKLYLLHKKLCQFITNLFFLGNTPTPG